jgi:phosphoribosyl-ATP pyrophosphohydrolase/phosphoribosyl-AMP cyclohydrolase
MTELGDLSAIRWSADGLVPVVIADARSGDVLTLAYANREAVQRTLDTRSTWLYSRSREALWNKGATSGNTQRVVTVALDCDGDALLYRVVPDGPACHTGADSCFSTPLLAAPEIEVGSGDAFASALIALAGTIAARRVDAPEGSYTAQLFAGGVDRIGKKIGEEATEVVIAAKNAQPAELIWESADLLYHLLVLLAERGVTLDDVGAELSRRAAPH